jgi:hypothetical protein
MDKKVIDKVRPMAGEISHFDFSKLMFEMPAPSGAGSIWVHFNGLYFFELDGETLRIMDPQPDVDSITNVEWLNNESMEEALRRKSTQEATESTIHLSTEQKAFIQKADTDIGKPNEEQKEALAQKIGISKEAFTEINDKTV